MNYKESGFTFLELILVVAIMLTITLMSTAFYSRFFAQNAVLVTQDQLAGQLRKAQIYAMMGKNYTGSNGGWGVNINSGKIILYQGSSFVSRNSALDETFFISPNVTITNLGDENFAHFTGTPSATPTVIVSGPTGNKTLTINSAGVVSK